MVYSMNKYQAKDVADILRALDVFTEDDDEPHGVEDGANWGDGWRAVMRWPKVPIYSDATGVDELLGYIERIDGTFYFRAEELKNGSD